MVFFCFNYLESQIQMHCGTCYVGGIIATSHATKYIPSLNMYDKTVTTLELSINDFYAPFYLATHCTFHVNTNFYVNKLVMNV